MKKINSKVKILDRLSIYISAGIKLMRGFIIGSLFHEKSFPLFIGKKVNILNKRSIFCGKNVKFEDYSEIQGLSIHGLHFGNNTTIGRYTEIRPSSYYGVGQIGYGLIMGEYSSIGPYGFIGCSGKIEIGSNVMIGPRVSLFAENHNFSDTFKPIRKQGVNNKGIKIENNCWIGSGVIILDGVTIGEGSVIGAGTLVAKDVLPNSVVIDKRIREEKKRE